MTDEKRLQSWKEIAAHFGYDPRTVKRWEKTRGLPVRRLPGARSGVYALVSELDAWQRGYPVSAGEDDPAPPDEPGSLAESTPSSMAIVPIEGPPDADEIVAPAVVADANLPYLRDSARLSHSRSAWVLRCAGILLFVFVAVLGARHWDGLHVSALETKRPKSVPLAQARELYLDGRFRWNKRTAQDLEAARADFGQAVRLDPNYAAAYAGLADCFALEPQFGGHHGESVFPFMLNAARRSLALDESLAEGHRALAFALFYWNWDKEGSRREFMRALALNPQDPTTHLWFANTLTSEGSFDEALHQIELARELDPTSVSIRADRGWILYASGRHTEGEAVWADIERSDPGYRMAHRWMAVAALDAHDSPRYLEELRYLATNAAQPDDRERLAAAEQGLQRGGFSGLVNALADLQIALYRRHEAEAYVVAESLARTSRTDETLLYLNKALDERNDTVVALNMPGGFPSLQNDARFSRLKARIRQPFPGTVEQKANHVRLFVRDWHLVWKGAKSTYG